MGKGEAQNIPFRDIIHMVAHCHEQVKEQLAAFLHLHLQCSALLENLSTSDDQSKIMSSQSRIRLGRVVICVTSGAQDHIGWDAALQPLLAKGKSLEVFQAVFFGGTVNHCVAKNKISDFGVKDCGFTRPAATGLIDILRILEGPRVSVLCMQQPREVLTLV